MADSSEIQVQEAEKQEVEQAGAERTRERQAFIPRVDIYETEDKICVIADMPGVAPESVDITLEKNVLTINGYVDFVQPEGYALAYAEYRVGDFTRSFSLSNEIDQEHIEANLKDGVLRLHMPKQQPTSKKITVSGA